MSHLRVTLIDVGWGDSVLIEASDGASARPRFALIDSNDNADKNYWPTRTFLRKHFGLREDEFFQTGHRHIHELRKRKPEPELFLHPETARAWNVETDEWVEVENRTGRPAGFIESDLVDPRYFAASNIKNRLESYLQMIEQKRQGASA